MMRGDRLKRANWVLRICVGALFVLVTEYCGRRAGPAVTHGEPLQSLVPQDTTSIAGVDLDRLKKSTFYLSHQSSFRLPLELARETGVDPEHDLSSMVLCWNGTSVLVVSSGRFQERVIKQRLASHSAAQDFEDHTIFMFGRYAFSLVTDEAAVAGKAASVERAIRSARGHLGGVPMDLSAALAWLPEADQFWVGSSGGLPFADVPMRSDYASILANFRGNVRRAAAGVAIDAGLHLKARIECNSRQDSRRVFDALRAGVGLARFSAKDKDPELARAYEAVHIKQEESIVYVEADFGSEAANNLLTRALSLNLRVSISRPR